jgi:preprotein translocase subunit SecD
VPILDQKGVGGWEVLLEFTSNGNTIWTGYTSKHNARITPGDIANRLAFVVDGKVISAPEIQHTLTGGTSITSDFDRTGAADLANALDSGALPLVLSVQSVVAVN